MSNTNILTGFTNVGYAPIAADADELTGGRSRVGAFDSLLPMEWKGLGIPYVDTRVELRQDLAVHAFADLDGADVEPTGRAPLQFTARLPFLNNITPSPAETWPVGDLYPGQFRRFFAACANRSRGVYQHPEFGPVTCVVAHCTVDWKASTRDGVYVDVAWLETFDANGQLSSNVTQAGDVSQATQSGADLDALLPSLNQANFPTLPKQDLSFADFARQLQSVSDQVSLLEYQTAGKLNAVVFRVNQVLDSISRATHSDQDTQASVQSWPTRDAADRYLAALRKLRDNFLTTGKRVGLYVPRNPTTLASLAQTIPAPIGDLMNLNPSLLFQLAVPANSRVRYYLAT